MWIRFGSVVAAAWLLNKISIFFVKILECARRLWYGASHFQGGFLDGSLGLRFCESFPR